MTLDKVGIPLALPEEYDQCNVTSKAYITGVNGDVDDFVDIPIKIHQNTSNLADEAGVSIGHELGHFFLFQQGYLHDDSHLKFFAEQLCELFGQELTLPVEYLSHIEKVDGATVAMLMELYSNRSNSSYPAY